MIFELIRNKIKYEGLERTKQYLEKEFILKKQKNELEEEKFKSDSDNGTLINTTTIQNTVSENTPEQNLSTTNSQNVFNDTEISKNKCELDNIQDVISRVNGKKELLYQIINAKENEKLEEYLDDKEIENSILSMTWKKIPLKYQLILLKTYMDKRFKKNEKIRNILTERLSEKIKEKKIFGRKLIVYDRKKRKIISLPAIVKDKVNKKYIINC